MSNESDPPPPNPYEPSAEETQESNSAGKSYRKTFVLLAVIALVAFAYVRFGDELTFEKLAVQENNLRQLQIENPWLVYGGAFVLYVAVSGLSVPGGAVVLSLTYGSYFGWLRAMLLVSFASTAGATVAFLLSRYIFHDFVQKKFAGPLKSLNEKLEREGAFYLFTLRLVPLIPFFMLNLVSGLTKMKTSTYWWVSQVGMLPGTAAFIYAGSTVSISELAKHGFQGLNWQFGLGFAILGILPLVLKKLLSRGAADARSPEDATI